MKSKTPSLTNPHHPLRRVAGHLGFVFAALSLGSSLGCSASSKSTAPDRVGPEAELDASATAFHTSDAGQSPTNPSSTDDASAPNDDDDAPETPSSPTTPTLVSADASVDSDEHDEEPSVGPTPAVTSPVDTDGPSQPKPPITSNETNTDAPDAAPAPTNGDPTISGDGGLSGDASARANTDAAVIDQPTPSIVHEVGVCTGDVDHERRCEGTPTPCSAYEYSEQCLTQMDCTWR